jgi:hypothetical protein
VQGWDGRGNKGTWSLGTAFVSALSCKLRFITTSRGMKPLVSIRCLHGSGQLPSTG